jgi:DNA repair exonuclease SbcCD ATPase subunit
MSEVGVRSLVIRRKGMTMLINEIVLERFMNHARTGLKLPSKGVTVITGANGQGKSALIEAVAYGVWGKTLRGTSPWPMGFKGSIQIGADSVVARTESTRGGQTSFKWKRSGEVDWQQFDTNTSARRRLYEEIGDLDLWRRTHVFSSADAAHFSSATDAERKRLIESVLGMDVFDRALEKCREDLRRASIHLGAGAGELLKIQGSVASVKMLLDNWQEVPPYEDEPAPQKPVDVPSDLLVELQDELLEIDRLIADASSLSNERVDTSFKTDLQAAEIHLERMREKYDLVASGRCGTCERPFKKGDLKPVEQDRNAATMDVSKKHKVLLLEQQAVESRRQMKINEVEAFKERRQKLQIDVDHVNRALGEQSRYERDLAAWSLRQDARRSSYEVLLKTQATKRSRATAALREAKDQLQEVEALVKENDQEVSLLEAVEHALGYRGVRVQVLAYALQGIEAVANGWLSRMAPGVTLHLHPYTETKTAGVNDQLSLVIEGVGGSQGYKAASGGERRRIDAALILGLAEIAAAARSVSQEGTLFMDEVFDALDPDGCAAIAECLSDIGKRRSVVVITHRKELVENIVAAQRFDVRSGSINEVHSCVRGAKSWSNMLISNKAIL